MGVVVYDVDGVLVDASERMRRARDSGDFWEAFLDPQLLALDKPVREMIERANRDIASGRRVVLLTGRPERLREATLEELRRFGLNVDGVEALLMRGDRDRRPAYLVKPSLLSEYLARTGGRVEEVYEDDEKVARRLRARHPEAKVYLVSRGKARPLRGLDEWLG